MNFVAWPVEGFIRLRALPLVLPRLAALEGAPTKPGADQGASLPGGQDFENVYVTYFLHVTRWVRAFGCPPADIEDVAQEVFLIARRHLSKEPLANLSGWLFRVAQRTTRAHRRRVWVSRVLHLEPDMEVDSHQAGPVEALEQREARRQMQRVLSCMTERRRTTFFLFEIEGYTGEEIAALEGSPVSTIYTRLHHARRDFMRLLAKSEGFQEGT
jgi:RNA polymerase sigma-70 factor (ECF subfamily)